jgi:hypothetical protein
MMGLSKMKVFVEKLVEKDDNTRGIAAFTVEVSRVG